MVVMDGSGVGVRTVPDLFGVAQLNVGALFYKLGVSLQEVDSPARVFLQVIKLILKQQTDVSVTFDL